MSSLKSCKNWLGLCWSFQERRRTMMGAGRIQDVIRIGVTDGRGGPGWHRYDTGHASKPCNSRVFRIPAPGGSWYGNNSHWYCSGMATQQIIWTKVSQNGNVEAALSRASYTKVSWRVDNLGGNHWTNQIYLSDMWSLFNILSIYYWLLALLNPCDVNWHEQHFGQRIIIYHHTTKLE